MKKIFMVKTWWNKHVRHKASDKMVIDGKQYFSFSLYMTMLSDEKNREQTSLLHCTR